MVNADSEVYSEVNGARAVVRGPLLQRLPRRLSGTQAIFIADWHQQIIGDFGQLF
jgi:hypothetical protein